MVVKKLLTTYQVRPSFLDCLLSISAKSDAIDTVSGGSAIHLELNRRVDSGEGVGSLSSFGIVSGHFSINILSTKQFHRGLLYVFLCGSKGQIKVTAHR